MGQGHGQGPALSRSPCGVQPARERVPAVAPSTCPSVAHFAEEKLEAGADTPALSQRGPKGAGAGVTGHCGPPLI